MSKTAFPECMTIAGGDPGQMHTPRMLPGPTSGKSGQAWTGTPVIRCSGTPGRAQHRLAAESGDGDGLMMWANRSTNGSTSSGSRNNPPVRGGTWTDKGRRLERERRRSERAERKLQRRTARRTFGRAVAAGAVILSAMLLMIPGTRGTGLVILLLTGLVLYVITRRKRA
jgi:hypothetical protein